MAAVTIDLWHTLLYLPPDLEERYMARQLTFGREVLEESPRLPGSPNLTEAELGRAFERAYVGAVQASLRGKTITPAEQILAAAKETGRAADPEEYLSRLKAEVETTEFRPAPGAVDLLSDLEEGGYHLGLISNTVGEPGALFRPILSEMGFDRYLETMVFSDEHPWTKPAPELFELALANLRTASSEAVHVGDGWSDLEGARRAGYRGAVLFTGLQSYGARYRDLFHLGGSDDLPAGLRTDHLSEVGPFVRKLLPLDPST
jgi:FMN phosphatase YigB (HAD superfamily)